MKKLGCAIAVAGLIGTPAFAADMGVPSGPPPAPVYNWTGWYVGVNAGASMGNVKTDFSAVPFFMTGVPDQSARFPNPGGLVAPDTTSPSGFIGGGQIGYNWQYSPIIVVGLEADFQGALEKDSVNLTNPFSFTVPLITGGPGNAIPTGTTFTDYTTQIDWFGTVRARIGYVWGNGQVMSYLTGGLAYGEVKINGTNTVNGSFAPSGGTGVFSITQTFGHSQVNTGWVAGYGTEGAIDFWGAHNWTWRIEGLYMDLGHLDTTGVISNVRLLTGLTSSTGGQLTTHSHFTDGILRGGLNYRF